MPVEDVEPDDLPAAAEKARQRCWDENGDKPFHEAAFVKVNRAIERAFALADAPPILVELMFARERMILGLRR
jgi:hypothetical protein